MQWVTEYHVTNISGTKPRKNMITMGKVDTSDLMMIITWAIDISFQSPILKWASYNAFEFFLGASLITMFMGPTWGPPGADRTHVGPMLDPWTLLSGLLLIVQLDQIRNSAPEEYLKARVDLYKCNTLCWIDRRGQYTPLVNPRYTVICYYTGPMHTTSDCLTRYN